MKKLISIILITFSLSILINCSPKVAKKTASSDHGGAKKEVAVEQQKSEQVEVKQVPVQDVNAVNAVTPNTPFAGVSTDEQITMYNDMAPLRAEIGKKLVSVRCSKCHGTPQAISKPAETWIHIMQIMGPRAKLNTDEYLEVTAYMVQNAKK